MLLTAAVYVDFHDCVLQVMWQYGHSSLLLYVSCFSGHPQTRKLQNLSQILDNTAIKRCFKMNLSYSAI